MVDATQNRPQDTPMKNTTKRDTCPTCSPDRKLATFEATTDATSKPVWECACCHATKPRRIMGAARARRSSEFDALCKLLGIDPPTSN